MTRIDSLLTARFHDCSYGTGMDRLSYGLHRATTAESQLDLMIVYDQLYDALPICLQAV